MILNLNDNISTAIPGFEHVKRYWDPKMNIVAAKILPGECYVANHGEMVVTVLGSCIAACIRDCRLGIGGMNHFMLPIQRNETGINRTDSINPALCYGNWAMEFLINAILKQGGRKKDMEVKIFGGGKVMSSMSNIDVGASNIDFVRGFLKNESLLIKSQDLGGECPRKVLYFPDTGAVKLKRIKKVDFERVEKRERDYFDAIKAKPSSSDIELF